MSIIIMCPDINNMNLEERIMATLMVFAGIIVLGLLIWLQAYIAEAFYDAALSKGYVSRKYYWLTFFCGVVGMLLVVALPQPIGLKKQNAQSLPEL